MTSVGTVLTTKGEEFRLSTSLHLNYREFFDLDQSELDTIMDNLVAENMNEVARRIKELGPAFTLNVDVCKEHLASMINGSQLSGKFVARLISVMISEQDFKCSTSSYDIFSTAGTKFNFPWDAAVLVQAVKVPGLDWHEVFYNLDNMYFNVRSRQALHVLTAILKTGIAPSPFPMQYLYNAWNINKNGQLSWLNQILQNPDIFYLCEHPHTSVNISCCKVPPDESNKSIAVWRCLELVEVVFRLGDVQNLTTDIYNILKGPMNTCPDVLLLGIVQINMPISQFRQHILKILVSQLLVLHSNAASVLNFMWNYEKNQTSLRQIILTAVPHYYAQNPDEPSRLARILEVAHELKPTGLSELFNLNQFMFVIDLACLAARRDFLKLDKFIEDKLETNGEPFAQYVIQFMKRRAPGTPQANTLPVDLYQIMLTALQSRSNLSPMIVSELSQLSSQMRKLGPVDNRAAPPTSLRFVPPSQQTSINSNSGAGFGSIGSSINSNSFVPKFTTERISSGILTPINFSVGENKKPSEFRPNNLGQTSVSGPYTTMLGTGSSRFDQNPNGSPFTDNSLDPSFSSEMQAESNHYFQQIFSPSGRMSTTEFVSKMKELRNSNNPRDKHLLECIKRNLFDEYRFFNQYPERELRITAEIFGGIIREGVIRDVELAGTFKRLIEALQADRNTPLWSFGIIAFTVCRSLLHQFPRVCQVITSTSNYNSIPQELREYVAAGLNSVLPSSQSSTPISLTPDLTWSTGFTSVANINTNPITTTPTMTMKFLAPKGFPNGASIMGVTNVDTLINATERDGEQIRQPSETIAEKVAFIFNNLCISNLQQKVIEIEVLISESGDDFLKWFSQYLVMKRITMENNFHTLYNSLLVELKNPTLDAYVKKETFRNIKILLRGDKRQAASNFGDRQILKNLGQWLGLITIGHDKQIISKELNLKRLLLDSFYRGQDELQYIVPFAARCLSAASKSMIFGPQSAWIYNLIKVLVEIHNEPDLKLNLKFEIEVLCNTLSIDLRSVVVGNCLKDPNLLPKLTPLEGETISSRVTGPSPVSQFPQHIQHTLTQPSISKSIPGFSRASPCTAGGKDSPSHGGIIPPKAIGQQIPQVVPLLNYNDISIISLAALNQHLIIPQHLVLFQHQPQLREPCKSAIGHAIKEIIGGVVDRSINVAISVTEHICRKDFAIDPDEQHLRRGAQQMMRAMTAGMASVTCREPLNTTILNYLRQMLLNQFGNANITAGSEQAKMVEEAALAITEANITVATNFVVKSACEKAIAEVEKRLENDYMARKLSRKDNRLFIGDQEISTMIDKVPESIKMQSGPVSEESLRIYDNFSSKVCGFKPLSPEDRFLEFARKGHSASGANTLIQTIKTPSSGYASFMSATPTGVATPSTPIPPGRMSSISTSQLPPNIMQHGMLPSDRLVTAGLQRIGTVDDHLRTAMPHLQAPATYSTRKAQITDQNLQEKVETILREWINICYTPMAQRDPQHALACIVQMMHEAGVLSTDEMITKFFKVCADICFDVSYRLIKNDNSNQQSIVIRQRCYFTLDAFSRLTCLMVKYSDGTHHTTKMNLLKKVLSIITSALQKDYETRGTEFNGMPFHRILIIMFNELTVADSVLEPMLWNIFETFGHTLFVLQPRKVPGFVYHWLDIIGHRNFIGKLLADNGHDSRSGAMYTQLIICHLKFLAPFLRNVQLSKSAALIYKGTLRILLVILHDFPEILCDYHYALCDAIPPNSIQLRNLVLSAYPRDMRLPDPFTQSMEMIEQLPEMSQSPKTHRDMTAIIPTELRSRLDDYLENRSSVNFLSDLPSLLLLRPPDSSVSASSPSTLSKYNHNVINSLVMYVGIRAIASIHERNERVSIATIAHTAFMDIFQNLAVSLCTEGRYLLLNAIANQLRYPNAHTHYFSCTLLYLFLEANAEVIQEQITRILFERLVALRPHPWGLLITFIELIRNPRYYFWKHEFVRCAPEIERLFSSVANSCSVQSSARHNHSPPQLSAF